MALNLSNTSIVNDLQCIFNSHMKSLLEKISCDYNLDKSELYQKYLDDSSNDSISLSIKKKRKSKKGDTDILCLARKADGQQCTRRKKDHNDFCGKHSNNLKYGRIDDEVKFSNNDNYINTTIENINGVDYLVDNNNIVYSYDIDNPVIIGKKNTMGKLVLLSDISL